MADDELCNILYQMAKYDWHDALCKSGRNPSDKNLQDMMDYFEQIELLEVVKQKSETKIVDDDTDKQKKSSSQHTKSAKAKANAKDKLPGRDKRRSVSYIQTPHTHPASDHMSMEDLYTSKLKLTKKLKKYKKQRGKRKSSYESESLDSDSDSS
eukprot:13330833-Ditylum_brightwellii.AAC.1